MIPCLNNISGLRALTMKASIYLQRRIPKINFFFFLIIKIQIRKIAIMDHEGKLTTEHIAGKPFSIEIEYDVNDTVFEQYIWIACTNHEGVHILTTSDTDNNVSLLGRREKGFYKTTFHFPATPKLTLNSGTYFFRIRIGYDKYNDYIIPIKIEDPTLQLPNHPGILITNKAWSEINSPL